MSRPVLMTNSKMVTEKTSEQKRENGFNTADNASNVKTVWDRVSWRRVARATAVCCHAQLVWLPQTDVEPLHWRVNTLQESPSHLVYNEKEAKHWMLPYPNVQHATKQHVHTLACFISLLFISCFLLPSHSTSVSIFFFLSDYKEYTI